MTDVRRIVTTLALLIGCTGNPKEGTGGDGDGGSDTSDTGTVSASGPSTSASTSTSTGATSTDATSSTSTAGSETQGVDSTTTATSGSTTSGADTTTQTTGMSTGSSTGDAGESSTGTMVITCEDLDLPDVAPTECSQDDSAGAEITIINDCESESIEVYWVDYQCNESSYQVISAGNQWSTDSFETHPWRIRSNVDQRLMAEVPGLTGNTTVQVP